MAEQQTVSVTEVPFADKLEPKDDKNYSIDTLVLLITTERLQHLKDKTFKELSELKERQGKVKTLHEVMRSINASTDEKGCLDCSKNKDLENLLKKAKELGVEIKDGKYKYTKEERDRLVENLRIAADDQNVENDLQLQTISRLTNERYESYQMARSILKPLHDAKMRKAQAMGGR